MATEQSDLTIRDAVPGDEALMMKFIRALAEHERATNRVSATEEKLHEIFFGKNKIADAIIAEWDGAPVGHALYYMMISSYRAEPMVYLEDVVVDPSMRSKGIGRKLMAAVAARGLAKGAFRMKWSAITENTRAIALYKKIGSTILDGDVSFMMQDDDLRAFAKEAGGHD